MEKNPSIRLSLVDTKVLKGVALIFLLIHHLFYIQTGLYSDIHIWGDIYLVNAIGGIGKICVTIFVFLSGYGLAIKSRTSNQSLTQFYSHRFVKLMANYWLIWIIFVPISIFCFGITLQDAYGNHPVLPMFFGDILGILNLFGLYGYNPTWWYYSLIIVCYAFYPFLYKVLNVKTVFPIILFFIGFHLLPVNVLVCLKQYLLTFVIGIVFAKIEIPLLDSFRYRWVGISSLLLMFFLLAARIFVSHPILFDNIILVVGIFAYKCFMLNKYLETVLLFLGKHSMNIFLFHTFIKTLWFPDYIYMTKNPIIIFFSLFGSCVLISILIESLKKISHFDAFVDKVSSLYVR